MFSLHDLRNYSQKKLRELFRRKQELEEETGTSSGATLTSYLLALFNSLSTGAEEEQQTRFNEFGEREMERGDSGDEAEMLSSTLRVICATCLLEDLLDHSCQSYIYIHSLILSCPKGYRI